MSTQTVTQPEAIETPSAIRSERAVLANLILDSALLPNILETGLTRNDFLVSDHARIFRVILDLCQQNAPVDSFSIAEKLGNQPALEALIDSLTYGALVERSHAVHHAKLVIKKARLRELAKFGEWMEGEAAVVDADPELLISAAIGKLQAVCG